MRSHGSRVREREKKAGNEEEARRESMVELTILHINEWLFVHYSVWKESLCHYLLLQSVKRRKEEKIIHWLPCPINQRFTLWGINFLILSSCSMHRHQAETMILTAQSQKESHDNNCRWANSTNSLSDGGHWKSLVQT